MNSVYGDSELISSCLGAPDVLLGAPVAPEVPGTLGSLGQTVDTSPIPQRWPSCLLNSENPGEGHFNSTLVQIHSNEHSNDLTRKGSDSSQSKSCF